MPAPAEILALLTAMSHDLAWLALGWHVVILGALAAVGAGWRPTERLAVGLLALPPSSVAIASFAYGNPFNGLSFGVLALALAASSRAASGKPVARGAGWASWVGGALIAYGLVYPHFVEGAAYRALYAAPVGVVPCPTLATLAGITLLAGGFGTPIVPVILASWAAFYAVFGIFRLGVLLDLGLLIAVAALGALRARIGRRWRGRATAGYSS